VDLDFQQAVEEVISSKLAAIEPTGSAVVIDNSTGGVLAMVGGFDYDREPFNLATNGHRQPGSAFKPFTLVRALIEGHSTSEVYSSQPKSFQFTVPNADAPQLFKVHNYEDQYLGSASIATATTYSDNSVYAELGLQVGPDDIAATSQAMGLQTRISKNPAMILGGLKEGVTPLEMAYAYSTIGRDGLRIGGSMDAAPGKELAPLGIAEVRNEEGDLVEDKTGASGENEVQTDQVIPEPAGDTAVGLLETVVSSGTGESAATGDFAWGKTGTTENNGDAWFCGGTEEITACVWVGHRDGNTPMETDFAGGPVDGGTYPALIWHDIVVAYESIVGSDGKGDEESSTTPTAPTVPAAPAPAAPAAPAPTEEPAAPAPEEQAPSAPAAPPAGGAPTSDGGTGTGAAG
jgi:penicillin-binding protein 1A